MPKVVGHRPPVHLRERLVHAQVPQLAIDEREAERRLAEHGVELGQVAVAERPELLLGPARLTAVALNACASSTVSGGPDSGRRAP